MKSVDNKQNYPFNHIEILSVFPPVENLLRAVLNSAVNVEVNFRSDSKAVESRSCKYLDLYLALAFGSTRSFLL